MCFINSRPESTVLSTSVCRVDTSSVRSARSSICCKSFSVCTAKMRYFDNRISMFSIHASTESFGSFNQSCVSICRILKFISQCSSLIFAYQRHKLASYLREFNNSLVMIIEMGLGISSSVILLNWLSSSIFISVVRISSTILASENGFCVSIKLDVLSSLGEST
ncbi:hypothetical protein ALC53_12322 [Atta colombica]|uniref:Uncharacterized protein n=1 Tax=Atta colombica TaxID=520822 RepID=A0A195AYR7_9HYME|nr:hypothetical protein ALC53_12322 [Atta colombica]